MKKTLTSLVILLVLSFALLAQETESLEKLLLDLANVEVNRLDDIDGFPVYSLKVKQLVDHKIRNRVNTSSQIKTTGVPDLMK